MEVYVLLVWRLCGRSAKVDHHGQKWTRRDLLVVKSGPVIDKLRPLVSKNGSLMVKSVTLLGKHRTVVGKVCICCVDLCGGWV